VVKVATPTSAPGSSAALARREPAHHWRRRGGGRPDRGFTLIELLVVLLIVALAGGLASLAIREPSATLLEREAARLQALLDGARAQARSTGVPVRWTLVEDGSGFAFVGLPQGQAMGWLDPGTRAEVPGQATAVLVLGPEPLIGAQRLVLRHGQQRLELATDGLGPFRITGSGSQTSP
jgi:general secretion pathway protein H